MSTELLKNTRLASEALANIKANQAVMRERFSASSIQTTGKVYVSNHIMPTASFSDSTVWAELTTKEGNMYMLSVPVAWIGATADAYICSFVEGDM